MQKHQKALSSIELAHSVDPVANSFELDVQNLIHISSFLHGLQKVTILIPPCRV